MDNYQEKLDIVDENDNVIGQDTRENIHKNGLLHRESYIIIYNDKDEILFQKRSMKKDLSPGLLDTAIGGHVDLGEDYEKTAIRELEEEAGIIDNKDNLSFIKKIRSKYVDNITGKINNIYKEIYSYKYNDNFENLRVQKDEIDNFEFWSLNKILNLSQKDVNKFIPVVIANEYLEIYKKLLNK